MMRRLVTALLLGALVLTACSGDGDDGEESGSPTTQAAAATTTTAGGAGGGGAGDTVPTAFCDVQSQNEAFQETFTQAFQNPSAVDWDLVEENFDRAVEVAPEEIRPDVQTLLTAFRPIVAEFRTARSPLDIDPAAAAAFQDPELLAAAERVSDYYQRVCS